MKKNFVSCTVFGFVLFIYSSAFAQSDSLLSMISDLSEDQSYLVELLQELEEQPININEADREDLLTLSLLTPQMADSIISKRKREGAYSSKRQIRPILGERLYGLLKTYITASQKRKYKGRLTQRTIYKIEKIKEIESGRYNGDALNNYSRLIYKTSSNITAGLVIQKDPGEKSYLDHYNFSLSYDNNDWYILLGDFYLQLAEGLSHNNPYGSQKSIYLAAVFRESAHFARANLTSSESAGKFGLFLQNSPHKSLTLFSFYSRAGRDARLSGESVSGFNFDGFHRSATELDAKNRFFERNWGGGVRYKLSGTLHILVFYNRYAFSEKIETSPLVIGTAQKRRRYFSFSGNKLSQATMACSWQFKNVLTRAEVSSSNKGRPGWTQSAYYSKDNLHLGVKIWYLNKDFQTIDGHSFDSNASFPQGEKGFFCGITLKLNEHNTFYAFKQYGHRLWRSYFNPMPTTKNEWLMQWDLESDPAYFTLRFRSRIAEDFISTNEGSQRIANDYNNIRTQVNFKPAKKLYTRTRWEMAYLKNIREKGTLFFQELNYHFNKDISLNSRFTFFSTPSFESRVYEYERDLPGTFSNVALFGSGNKMYLLLKWKINPVFSLWCKWRYVSKDNIYEDGNIHKAISRDIRLQLQSLF